MTKRGGPTGTATFNVARGSVQKLPRVIAGFLALMTAWVLFALAILRQFGQLPLLLLPAGLVALGAGLLVFLNLPGKVKVGADGLLVDWRGSKQFVAFDAIDSAETYTEQSVGKTFVGVLLTMYRADPIRLLVGEDVFGAADRADEMAAHIGQVLAAHRAKEGDDDAEGVRRGGRSVATWVQSLQSVGSGASAGPREAPIPRERLWRIVENPAVDASARAGAAVALKGALDDEGKERLRVVAEATVEPKLRVALEAAAEDDEGELGVALEKIARVSETER